MKHFVVQAYRYEGLNLLREEPLMAPTETAAIARAEALSHERPVVHAFFIDVDEDVGFVGDPIEIWRSGAVPTA